jgi:shikimate kinase
MSIHLQADHKKAIILIGMAGVGKSTCGFKLARKLNFDFTDLDSEIVKKAGKEIYQIMREEGEECLLEIERITMNDLNLSRRVVAPGGSIIYHSDLMLYLKKEAIIIYLKDEFRNIASRIKKKNLEGLIGGNSKTVEELFIEREPLYYKYADIVIDIDNSPPDKIVEKILKIIS